MFLEEEEEEVEVEVEETKVVIWLQMKYLAHQQLASSTLQSGYVRRLIT